MKYRITLDAADVTAQALAPWTISWEHPARSHAQPGRITGRLLALTTSATAPRFESEIVIQLLDIAGRDITLGRGWISAWKRRRVHAGWLYDLEIDDVIARAAATRISSRPWPTQSATDRQRAINASCPTGQIVAEWSSSWTVAARDTDSRSALDLLQLTCRPDVTVAETAHGIQLRPAVGPLLRADALGVRIISPIIDIRASAIHDGARHLDRRAMLTAVKINLSDAAPSAAKQLTYTRPHPTSSAALSITTDWLPHTDGSAVEAWAYRLLDGAAAPTERLADVTILSDQLEPETLARLLDIDSRAGTTIRIFDGPDDLATYWTVAAATITISDTSTPPLLTNVSLEPPAWSGLHAARFRNLPANAGRARECGDLRLTDFEVVGDPSDLLGASIGRWRDLPYAAGRHTDAQNLRISDLNTIS